MPNADFVPYDQRVREWLGQQPPPTKMESNEFVGRRLYFSSQEISADSPAREWELKQILDYLQFVIWAEQGVVTEVCEMIDSNRRYDFSPDLRVGANSIQSQESEHSRRAYQLLTALETAEGRTAMWEVPSYGLMLDHLIGREPHHADLAKLLFVIFVEVVDFHTASQLIAQADLAEPIRGYAVFHETEEILHRVYFRKILEELVPQLSANEGLFSAYAIRALMRSFALDEHELAQDSPDTWPVVVAKCGQAINYLRGTGFLEDPERRRLFEQGLAS